MAHLHSSSVSLDTPIACPPLQFTLSKTPDQAIVHHAEAALHHQEQFILLGAVQKTPGTP